MRLFKNYEEANKKDFSEKSLPTNRTEQFFDLFKNRFFTLSGVSLLAFSFAIPLVFWMYVIIYQKGLALSVEDASNSLTLLLTCFEWDVMMYAVALPLILLFFIGLSGAFHIIQLLIWREGINIIRDFFLGIKENYFKFLISGVIITIGLFLFQFNNDFIKYGNLNPIQIILSIVGTSLVLYFSLTVSFYMMAQSVHYQVNMKNCFRNAFIFSISMFPLNILSLLFILGPFVITLFLSIFVQLIYLIMIWGIVLVLMVLIWLLYSNYVFDRLLNSKIEGAKVGRGLYHPNKE